MTSTEFNDLLESIHRVGQLSPVVVDGGMILEGRHRAEAVEMLRAQGIPIELQTVQWEPTESCSTPSEYIANVNLHRRHLTPDQRAIMAAAVVPHIERERAERQQSSGVRPGEQRNPAGRNQHTQGDPGDKTAADVADAADTESDPPSKTQKNREKREASLRGKVAAQAGVSHHKADQAVTVDRYGTADQIEAVREGKKPLAEAVREIKQARGKPAARGRSPIAHPFMPADDFEYDCLRAWTNFIQKQARETGKAHAREVFLAIFKAEKEAEEKETSTPPKPEGGRPGKPPAKKKSGTAPAAKAKPAAGKTTPEEEISALTFFDLNPGKLWGKSLPKSLRKPKR